MYVADPRKKSAASFQRSLIRSTCPCSRQSSSGLTVVRVPEGLLDLSPDLLQLLVLPVQLAHLTLKQARGEEDGGATNSQNLYHYDVVGVKGGTN